MVISRLNSKLSQDVKTNAILQKIAENTGISVKIADEDLKRKSELEALLRMNDDYGSYKNNGVMGYNQEDAFLGSKEYEASSPYGPREPVLKRLKAGEEQVDKTYPNIKHKHLVPHAQVRIIHYWVIPICIETWQEKSLNKVLSHVQGSGKI